jgi:hypothetical protein
MNTHFSARRKNPHFSILPFRFSLFNPQTRRAATNDQPPMKMPPAARKAYMTFVLVAVAAYLCAIGYRGARWLQQRQEHTALAAGESLPFLSRLAPAIDRYAADHHGELPRDIPLADLPGSEIAPTANPASPPPDTRLLWNAAIRNLGECGNTRSVILWLDDPRYPHDIAALTTTGQGLTAEIIPRSLVHKTPGQAAALRK